MGELDVIVVGAGFAGLIAARDLAQRGCNVLTLEARDRIGGRAYSEAFPEANCSVELGGAWFDANVQTPTREEADRYGVPIAEATPYQTTRWFTGGELRTGLPISRWDGGALERTLFEINAAARELPSASPEQLRALDVPLSTWLNQLDPHPAVRDFVYGWTSLMTGAHPDDAPALGMLGMIAQHGGAYAFYAELKHVFADGTESLAQAIAADTPGEMRLETPVRAIRQHDGGVRVETDAETFAARLCVLAVPVNVMGGIAFEPDLEPERARFLGQGHNCTMTKVWMLATGVPDRMLAAGWHTPFYWLSAERQVGDAQLVVAFALRGAVDASNPGALERALRVYAPEANVLAAISHDWLHDPWARGGWMTDPPGWYSAGAPDLLAKPHGRVFMAGSDVSPRFGGWIAGAIASGRIAARDVAERLTVPAPA